jgi:hypothetical protein
LSKSQRIETAFFIPPEGVAKITGEVTYNGRYYEYLGTEIVGAIDDPVLGQVAGAEIPKLGGLVQAVDDGDPTTPVWYERYDGIEADYTPIKRHEDYEANIQKYIVDGAFEGHPIEEE